MSKDVKINVKHLTRVEGHGNIVVDVNSGKIEKVEWQVSEAPRFFETMVVGREYSELATITSRICGICSIGHTFASLKATEAALGVEISEQTRVLRELLLHGETMQSHILHVCYLVLPDLFKVGSVLPLIESHKEVVLLVTKIHRLANELCDIIGGRTTHPIRPKVGHFTMLPTRKELEGLKVRLEECLGDLKQLAETFQSVSDGFPEFSRETEYVSLTNEKEYAFYDGEVTTTDIDKVIKADEYRGVVNEFVVPQSTAKYGKFNRESFMVGALARYNNNHAQLTSLSKEVAELLGLSGINYSPYQNNAAQIVECVFAVERSINHVDWLLLQELKVEKPEIKVKNGRGVGAVEVPRGILFHDYTYNDDGICVAANCVIPTNLNHNNIQKDFEKMVPAMLDIPQEELRFNLEMLVRAYDPCISCSTHYLNVEFKK
ncbi:MAG: Ni/Fe hydrogenase subunit alpha [Candidatus Aminicenantes bacterium]|nr:Ni/Fe hydrogenase subunit alpha [Candidatus Aminicenantes bacterium]